ncbi:hypothetical protein CAPTEDRAFT_93615 [Capitella teleta]|uniref:receptor protein-tyrosine kinase n=1 Tax=Capitella teleta TaxID=283909 RepID=R7ULE7_CAPTE|nr:hypothetical protein CAPTEDRAFT_93615 [Capitella teleta]|eukprot:ELU04082.1 hypothetical protein CAPTEDRAFT_93615 [Capitella teleta]
MTKHISSSIEYNVTNKDIVQFLEEATLMSNFNHEHVLGLTGVVIRGSHPYVVLPFMENGDLKSFISNDDNMLTVGELIHFGMQIADGMNYLAEKRFVHRDLACRNCMVNRDMVVRVADFGLSRDIYTNDYYRVNTAKRPLPVKWMAVESLESGKFDSKSDVWSFGVVMWELLTRGCQPYPDVDNFDIRTYILCGNRMDRPDYAPDEMYLMMLECWADNPLSRPSFRKIYNRIATFLDESSTKTVLRNKQGQQVPSIAYRGRSFIDVSNTDRLSFDYSQAQF